MPSASSVSRYARSARLLHWLMALLVLLAYVLILNRGQFERGSLERQWVTLSHFWVGLLVLALVLPRLLVRHRHPVPPITPPLTLSLETVGRLTHYALYAFLLAQPLLGLFTFGAIACNGRLVSSGPRSLLFLGLTLNSCRSMGL